MDDGSGRRFHFRDGFAHRDSCNSLDLRLERAQRALEELTMKLPHLGGPFRSARQGFLSQRERLVQRDHQRPFAENDRHRLGSMTGSLLLEVENRMGHLLCHCECGLIHDRLF